MTIDYNTLAKQYSQYRTVHAGVLQNLMETAQLASKSHVLEVGCGTGNYILAIQVAVGGWCVGVDPSEKMLEEAQARPGQVLFRQGGADKLSFPDGSFDLVFSVDVAHHLLWTGDYVREAVRVLKPGGRFCTVTEDETLIRTRIPLSRYFPETVEKELERYPDIAELKSDMVSSGLTSIQEVIVHQPYEIYDLKAYESRAFSVLHLISEEAYQCGLQKMRADLTIGPIQAVSHYLLAWGVKE